MRSPAHFSDLKYFATLDDPYIHHLAINLAYLGDAPTDSDRKTLKYLYRLFRDNFDYVTDKSHFGVDDFWEFPVDFFEFGGGDCDGFSLAFTSLAHAFGLDTYPVIISDKEKDVPYHMITGTDIGGRTIYIDPTTGQYDVHVDAGIIYYTTRPIQPSQEFLSSLERYKVV